MLCYNPSKRPTAKECLNHDWFKPEVMQNQNLKRLANIKFAGYSKTMKENQFALTKPEVQNALANMKTFKVTQKLKQATYAYIVTHLLTKQEKKPLAKLYLEINSNYDGHLSKDEVAKAFEKYFGNAIDKEDIDKMFNTIDVSGSGQIEFSEFLLATIPEKILLTNENMAVVFKQFVGENGQISKEEIMRVFNTHSKRITEKVA